MKSSDKPSLFPQRHYGRDYQSPFAKPLQYHPRAIFTFGVKYLSQFDCPEKTPHRLIGIKEDCSHRAKKRAFELLKPNAGEYIVLVKKETNPEYDQHHQDRIDSVLPTGEAS